MNRAMIYGVLLLTTACGQCQGCIERETEEVTLYSACSSSAECGDDAPLCQSVNMTDVDGGMHEGSWCSKECDPARDECSNSFGGAGGIYGFCLGIDETGQPIDVYFEEDYAGETYCFEECYSGDGFYPGESSCYPGRECVIFPLGEMITRENPNDGTIEVLYDGTVGVCIPTSNDEDASVSE